MHAVQISLNNTLRSYGASSIYGSDIPLACVGVITKVNALFMAFIFVDLDVTEKVANFVVDLAGDASLP